MRKSISGSVCALVVFAVSACVGCSKSEPQQQRRVAEVGDAVGIEFGDAKTGHFLAAVAAEKGHSPEKGVPALATALHEAASHCPTLVQEAADPKRAPTLHFLVKNGRLEAAPSATPEPTSECMTKGMTGKATNLEAAAPFELTIQLMTKPDKSP